MTEITRLNEYQLAALSTMVCPPERRLVYCALKLNGEAGEVAEKIGKAIRRDGQPWIDNHDLALELGDVLWYIAALADEIGYDLQAIAEMNVRKLEDRKLRGVIRGSGDYR